VENRDELLAELRVRQERDAAEYCAAAEKLTEVRRAAAARLEKLATAEINDLAMTVRFKVQVTAEQEAANWATHGWNRVECLIATNAGEPLKPLDQIASGGEMSRVLLALKVTVEESFAAGSVGHGKKKAQLPTPRMLVFDEIDIGIGGRAAEAVGRKLKALAKRQQVVCITHLPQIAAFADQHFVIEKAEKGGRMRTSVRRMEEGERAQEIARMLSGAKLTQSSLEHARSLLKSSR
jgi:DNA repair protein RecN (Recombination protein N)